MTTPPAARVGLETSVRAATVAADTGQGIRSRGLEEDRAHASDLLPCLRKLLGGAGNERPQISLIAVGTGPGSYTGLRVGIATALGLAEGTGADLVGVPSVEALVWEHLRPGEVGAVVLDARGGEFYVACYERTPQDTVEVVAPVALKPADVPAQLPANALVFTEPSLVEHAALAAVAPARLRAGLLPNAESVLRLGEQRFAAKGPQDPREVRPLYLRPFGVRPRKR